MYNPGVDTLTQIALGATVAEAGFRHRLGGKAVLLGAACGLAPDLDMLSRLGGEFASMVHHRGITHSLLALAVVSPLVGYAGYRWSGKRDRWLVWTHLAFWALVTHPLLDLFTTYGTQLFTPLTDHRYALDAVSVVDLVCSLPLWIVGLWSLIRARREALLRRRWLAAGALVWTFGYLLVGWGLSQTVVKHAQKQLRADGFTPVEVRATPTMLVTGTWRVVARNDRGDLRVGLASSWAGERVDFRRFDRPRDALVNKALASPRGRMMQWFTGNMFRARVDRTKQGGRVVLADARFGLLSDVSKTVFRLQFDFDSAGRLRRVRRLSRGMDFSLGQELGVWWRVLTTGHSGQPGREP